MKLFVHDYAGHPFQVGLSQELARRGHAVVHAFFGADRGPKGTFSDEDDAGVTFVAVGAGLRYDKSSLARRWIADGVYGRSVAKLILAERPDVVISGNTPVKAQDQIQKACKKAGIPFIFWLQDWYSRAASLILSEKYGIVGSWIGTFLRRMEVLQLQSSEAIVLIADDFRTATQDKSINNDKIFVIENWGPIDKISVQSKSNDWSSSVGLAECFTFLYTGTLALKHNPNLLISLARTMKERATVVVVSEGVGNRILETTKKKELLDNLVLFPLQPFEIFEKVLATANVLVAMIEPSAGEFSVPSKVQSYLCSGRPILLAAPSTNLASKVVSRERAGVVVDPADEAAFLRAAEELYGDHMKRDSLGRRGRAYAETTYRLADVATRFEAVFRFASLRQSRTEV